MLFVTDCIQVVLNALPRKLLKALETLKLKEKQYAESTEAHVPGKL